MAPPFDEPVPPPVDVPPVGGVAGDGLGAGVGAVVPVFVPDTGDLSLFMPAKARVGRAAARANSAMIFVFTHS